MGGSTVSVVIPAYNPRAGWLAEAVESAVTQDPAPLEVLVVDDGSDVPVVYDHRLVRVIRQDNAGVAVARNTGVREARGEYVAFLDQDDRWWPGKLAAQLALMARGAGLCSTEFDIDRGGRREPGWGGPGVSYRHLLSGNPIGASTVLAERGALLRVGGFDPAVRGADDWGAWLRVAQIRKLAHVPEPLVTYRVHEEAFSTDYRAMWRASMKVLWRHRRALPVRGVRRMGQIYGAQAFDAFRSTRRLSHLVWATALWPGYVARQMVGQRPRRAVR